MPNSCKLSKISAIHNHMTHEILIAESRKELEWLDRKDQYRKMLFNYAIQSYSVCLYFLDQIARKNWQHANLYLMEILQKLIELQIVNLRSQKPQIQDFHKNNIVNTKQSTTFCMLSIQTILYNSSYSYGEYALLNVSKIKKISFLSIYKTKRRSLYPAKNSIPSISKEICNRR